MSAPDVRWWQPQDGPDRDAFLFDAEYHAQVHLIAWLLGGWHLGPRLHQGIEHLTDFPEPDREEGR